MLSAATELCEEVVLEHRWRHEEKGVEKHEHAHASHLQRAEGGGAHPHRHGSSYFFASEGIQKFLYPETLGAGRLAKIGIPAPNVMGPFVGAVEIVCGLLILAGLATRLAAIPLIVDMIVAILSTKVPILLGHGYLRFAHTFAPKSGFWSMLHETRTDLSMLLGSVFLLLVGAGAWSADAWLVRRVEPEKGVEWINAQSYLAFRPAHARRVRAGAASLRVGGDPCRGDRPRRRPMAFGRNRMTSVSRSGEVHLPGLRRRNGGDRLPLLGALLGRSDRNWGYADYQLRKIETAIANGVERRQHRRGASAKMLDGAVAPLRAAQSRSTTRPASTPRSPRSPRPAMPAIRPNVFLSFA